MNTLAKLLSSRVKSEVLRLLFGLTARELHLREMERQSGLSVSTVRQELRRLTGLGLITARQDGNRTYYQANTQHPLYVDIRSLVLKTSGLVEVLQKALHDADLQVAFVFGSLASGAEQAQSDVDLLIIGSVGLRKVSALLTDAAKQLAREINPHIMTPAEFARKLAAGDHFITSVLNSPRVLVLGNEDDLAAMGG
jgi:DNA-binding transcriptional ArsR family regulator